MTDKDKLAKVRAEIERVKKNQEGVFTSYTDGKFDLCEHLLSFIDSMQEEPVNNDFEMALAEMISKAQTSVIEPLVIAAQWKDELIKLAKGKEPVSDDFKEFEVEYLEREKDNIVCVYDRHAGLVDGANWQKQKDESKVLTEEQCRKLRDDAFELGKDVMKQQMMAKAVDARCFGFQGAALFSFGLPAKDYLVGSKIKVIIIKE